MLWIIIGSLGFLVLITAIVIYNKLVRLRNTMRSSWSDIDVQLKKRHDLVPNLVDTVKGYARHEKNVLEEVTEARAKAMQSIGPEQAARSESSFLASLGKLFVLVEAYPDLKANSNFLQLQGEFRDLEDNIEAARRYYNAVVRDYNTATETFPSVIIAAILGFKPGEFFQLESPEERDAVRPDL